MAKIGRNDSCPCGSGKKYKKCCLGKNREEELRLAARERREQSLAAASDLAVRWLLRRHDKAVEAELRESYFGLVDPELYDTVGNLPIESLENVRTNAYEWLLAQGRLTIDGEPKDALDLVLGDGGPRLDDEQKRWLERFRERPLVLYAVHKVETGRGVWLRPLTPDGFGEPLWLGEPKAGDRFQPLGSYGLRLLPDGDGSRLSPAFYTIENANLLEAEDAVRRHTQGTDGADRERRAGEALLASWLGFLLDYELTSQDESAWTVDEYAVRDWERLAAVLAEQYSVEGGRAGGWVRYRGELDPEVRDWQLALNPTPGGERLRLCTLARRHAIEGRRWLTELAGDAVAFERRESLSVDPLPRTAAGSASSAEAQERLEEIYENWGHEPHDLVDGKTPFLALRAEKDLMFEVLMYLDRVEQREREGAEGAGREPASFQFLWDALGADREATEANLKEGVERPVLVEPSAKTAEL